MTRLDQAKDRQRAPVRSTGGRAAPARRPAEAGTAGAFARHRLRVLAAVAACFLLLWVAIRVFAQVDLWPLLAIPIFAGSWFFYEVGALASAGAAWLLLTQAALEHPGTASLAVGTFAVLGVAIGFAQRRQHRIHRRILRHSLTDPLTGLFNYGYFIRALEREISRADRYGGAVTLVMLDVDHFKLFNDQYGHEKGNEALKVVAATLKREKRQSDVAARYGGEEFVLLLPEGEAAGVETANRMKEAIARAEIPVGGGASTGVTVSVGVATYPDAASSRDELLEVADSLLYASKRKGRNQVSVAEARQQLAVI